MPEEKKTNMTGVMVGVLVTVATFFGGFMLFFTQDISQMGIFQILLFVMFIPFVGAIIGVTIMIRSMNIDIFGGVGTFNARMGSGERVVEKSYVHEPPPFCSSCGGKLASEDVDWIGPLTVKCPYCGATLQTEKREV